MTLGAIAWLAHRAHEAATVVLPGALPPLLVLYARSPWQLHLPLRPQFIRVTLSMLPQVRAAAAAATAACFCASCRN